MSAIKTVWVAIYENRHGTYPTVFEKEADAWHYREELADLYWEDEFPGEPRPDDPTELGTTYFEDIDGEWFSVVESEIIPASEETT